MASMKDGQILLGKVFDMPTGKLTDELVNYDPSDLTTHGIVTGMTGSGKTGLCIGMLEEAAIEGIPAIIIDPKADLTNLLLHFPNLLPEDFKPWIDPDLPRRSGKTLDEVAAETAENWKNGLAGWNMGPEQLTELSQSVDFGLFTPGSSMGTQVNILSSFSAPEIPWSGNEEILREKISTIVTALLGLVGMTDIDPLKSREHILLSNILESAWSNNKSLDLTELILQVQNPPFERLGAFPVNSFFPEKDRFALAMLLNNFLASPTFENWRKGIPLDIGKLLYSPSGKARHNIFYIAHLNDNERMFFVTLLFASIESWMRTQRGTSALRALVYFDEILGYLPPIANPPSRPIMLRMLKQARAFGVGILLATQNPVDVDYKGLSNAGTWLIGRLQTERDKARLLDGLDSAGGGMDRSMADQLISKLGKRTFLLHNVHSKGPKIFQTRWVLNYLAGPLTRDLIPQLMKLIPDSARLQQPVDAAAQANGTVAQAQAAGYTPIPSQPAASSPIDNVVRSTTKPLVPAGVNEFYLPNDLSLADALRQNRIAPGAQVEQQGLVYHPLLLAQAAVGYKAPKYALDFVRSVASVPSDVRGQLVSWDDFISRAFDRNEITRAPLQSSQFTALPGWLSDAKLIKKLEGDFLDWVTRNASIEVKANSALKMYAGPEVSDEEFRADAAKSVDTAMQAELDEVEKTFDKKRVQLESKIRKQEMEVDQQDDDYRARKMEEVGQGASFLAGLFGIGRKKSLSSSMTKRRLTSKSKAELEQEKAELDMLQSQLENFNQDKETALQEIRDRWSAAADKIDLIPVTPYRKDIYTDFFGIAWAPYYVLRVDGSDREIPAFSMD